MKKFEFAVMMAAVCCLSLRGEESAVAKQGYVLAADDGLSVNVVDLTELDAKTVGIVRIDHQGSVNLPLAGRIRAAGLTVEGLEKEIEKHLSSIMKNPEVRVSIAEYRNHPVSVLGAVKIPGVYQVSGQKSLFEVLSMAGGLSLDAGNQVKITRQVSSGLLPLPGATTDVTGKFQIGELNVRSLVQAKSPDDNITVLSNDVITVPKAEFVYIVGAVKKAGGFPLTEKEQISVLQAVSMAEGLNQVAGAKNARILRQGGPGSERSEVRVNVARILDGRDKDVELKANDILFIPVSAAKSASMRAIEAAVQAGTGLAVFGR